VSRISWALCAVTLQTDKAAAYFKVLPPRGQDALFVGSTAGERFDGTPPETGDYRIRVYLMRAADRRGAQAHYRLEAQIGPGRQAAAYPPDFVDSLAGGPDFW
jgi:hypothetical protein